MRTPGLSVSVRCTLLLAAGWAATTLLAADLAAQNSGRKIRVPPSAMAARAGTGVEWRAGLQAALDEAKGSGKRVFWYVPTVARSPMDRQVEIDRYMMAGPFSWPSTIARLNAGFVPVKAPAVGAVQKTYGLTRGEFVEPGFLVLDGDGTEVSRADQISTFHPRWFDDQLRPHAGDAAQQAASSWPGEAWMYLGDPVAYPAADVGTWGTLEVPADAADAQKAEALFYAGAARWLRGQDTQARLLWQQLGGDFPDSPWAWKAAMEREGHGPLVHGFEVYGALPAPPDSASQARGTAALPETFDVDDLWRRGVAYLLTMQRENGGFEDSLYDFGGTDSLPNVYVASTAIAGRALLAAHRRGIKALEAPLAKIFAYVVDDARLNTNDSDEILWAYSYRIRFLEEWLRQRPGDEAAVTALQHGVDALQGLQPNSGAWAHEYPNPFAIATALCALDGARRAGATVDTEVVDRGVLALLECRSDSGAYSYGYGRRRGNTAVEGAAGRMPRCELALALWEREPQEGALQRAVQAGLEHHGLLADVRKYDDHASRLGYGGFFFWYDMLGRTEAALALTGEGMRDRLLQTQGELILALPEIDGVFVDSHELGRAYGTGMALWCLDLIASRK